MAVTKIWAVKGRVDKVLSYVKNPEKTDTALRDALHYAVNDMKTEKGFYVTGINCDPETAEKQFTIVKRQFGKEGGIIAYHAYQSFAADEVNPKEAHEIGLQLAEKLWGKDYQVIVATHFKHRLSAQSLCHQFSFL